MMLCNVYHAMHYLYKKKYSFYAGHRLLVYLIHYTKYHPLVYIFNCVQNYFLSRIRDSKKKKDLTH